MKAAAINRPWVTRSSAKIVRFGANANSAVGTERISRLSVIARLRSILALNAPTSRPATAIPNVVELAATPISDGITPYSMARLGKIAWVANRSTNVRKPITAINSDRAGERIGSGGAMAAADSWFMTDLSTGWRPARGLGRDAWGCRLRGRWGSRLGEAYLLSNTSDDSRTAGSVP